MISQNADVKLLDILVQVDSLNHANKTDGLEADTTETDLFDAIFRVLSKGLSDILSSFRREVVAIEFQFRDVVAACLLKNRRQMQCGQVTQIILVEFEITSEVVIAHERLSKVPYIIVGQLFVLITCVIQIVKFFTAFFLRDHSLAKVGQITHKSANKT